MAHVWVPCLRFCRRITGKGRLFVYLALFVDRRPLPQLCLRAMTKSRPVIFMRFHCFQGEDFGYQGNCEVMRLHSLMLVLSTGQALCVSACVAQPPIPGGVSVASATQDYPMRRVCNDESCSCNGTDIISLYLTTRQIAVHLQHAYICDFPGQNCVYQVHIMYMLLEGCLKLQMPICAVRTRLTFVDPNLTSQINIVLSMYSSVRSTYWIGNGCPHAPYGGVRRGESARGDGALPRQRIG